MPYVGPGKGFITFGTLAHRILVLCHELGKISQHVAEEELGCGPAHVSKTLRQLTEAGFLHKWKRERRPGKRSHTVWKIEKVEYVHVRKLTPAERSKIYREKMKIKVPSVFNFRGRMEI